jgi:hypothetical protein
MLATILLEGWMTGFAEFTCPFCGTQYWTSVNTDSLDSNPSDISEDNLIFSCDCRVKSQKALVVSNPIPLHGRDPYR